MLCFQLCLIKKKKILQNMKQTKIVCSISDRRCEVDFLRKLFFAGMNVVRMNTAHATPDGIKKIIRNTRTVSPHLALLIDTKGPEVRTTGVDTPIAYKTSDVVKLLGRPDVDTSHDIINLSYKDIAKDVKVGDRLLLHRFKMMENWVLTKVLMFLGSILICQL